MRTADYDNTKNLGCDLAYDKGACRIGFNYNGAEPMQHHWMACVLAWMAVRVGQKRIFKLMHRGYPAPYIVLDGDLPVPILDVTVWRDRFGPDAVFTAGDPPHPHLVDALEPGVFRIEQGDDDRASVRTVEANGYYESQPTRHWYTDPKNVPIILAATRSELDRLTKLWEEQS